VVSRAVIPAAGLGTRFLPATKVLPKEILPVVDVPVIELAVDEARAAGATDITLVTSPGKELLVRHFEPSPLLESYLESRGKLDLIEKIRGIGASVRVGEVTQAEPLGLGHAVLQAEEAVGDEYFGCLLPDDVYRGQVPVLKQLVDVHEKYGCTVLAVRKVPRENIERYGCIKIASQDGGVYEVADLVEKPKAAEAPSDMAVMGRYVLSPAIFDALRQTQPGAVDEIQLTDGIRGLLGHEKVVALEYKADYFDVGTIAGWLKTSIALGRARPEFREEIEAYLALLMESPADHPPPTG
jgi:UTP--glucose-1-phosphate uridylyltransferase